MVQANPPATSLVSTETSQPLSLTLAEIVMRSVSLTLNDSSLPRVLDWLPSHCPFMARPSSAHGPDHSRRHADPATVLQLTHAVPSTALKSRFRLTGINFIPTSH